MDEIHRLISFSLNEDFKRTFRTAQGTFCESTEVRKPSYGVSFEDGLFLAAALVRRKGSSVSSFKDGAANAENSSLIIL